MGFVGPQVDFVRMVHIGAMVSRCLRYNLVQGRRHCRVLSLEKTVVSTCRDPVVRPSFMRRAVVVYLCGC